jgi:hypothetical protein
MEGKVHPNVKRLIINGFLKAVMNIFYGSYNRYYINYSSKYTSNLERFGHPLGSLLFRNHPCIFSRTLLKLVNL